MVKFIFLILKIDVSFGIFILDVLRILNFYSLSNWYLYFVFDFEFRIFSMLFVLLGFLGVL